MAATALLRGLATSLAHLALAGLRHALRDLLLASLVALPVRCHGTASFGAYGKPSIVTRIQPNASRSSANRDLGMFTPAHGTAPCPAEDCESERFEWNQSGWPGYSCPLLTYGEPTSGGRAMRHVLLVSTTVLGLASLPALAQQTEPVPPTVPG